MGTITVSNLGKAYKQYPTRWDLTEALLPLVRSELEALAAAGVSQTRFLHERTYHATTQAQFSEAVALAEKTARLQSENNRATEQELRNAQDQNAEQAEALLAAVDSARAIAAAANERLRDAAQDLAAVARSRCAASTTPGSGPPGADALDLLAELLGSVDEAAGKYAAEADASRIRGLTCEAAYDNARQALNGAPS